MEGLPMGNGRLAAMALGKPDKLRIALNHEWMWRGENRLREVKDVSAHLSEVRKALLAGDFLRGTALANEYFGGAGGIRAKTSPGRVDPYQPVGDVWVEMDAPDATEYQRSLDLAAGLCEVGFQAACGQVRQRAFVSSVDGCCVVEVQAERGCDIAVSLTRIDDPKCTLSYVPEENCLRIKGAFTDGISFEACVRASTDGALTADGGTLRVKNATRLLLLIQVGTDTKRDAPDAEMVFPTNTDFDRLFARHAARFAQLLGDAVLDVDVPHSDLPTDQRIRAFREGQDPGMPLLYFAYGRYLMASGSSGELPLNLQGKRNEDLQPPWESDYHLDINLQMCYWFVETLGMPQADTLFTGRHAVQPDRAVRAVWPGAGAAPVRLPGRVHVHPDRRMGAPHAGILRVGGVAGRGAVAGAAPLHALAVHRRPRVPRAALLPLSQGSDGVL